MAQKSNAVILFICFQLMKEIIGQEYSTIPSPVVSTRCLKLGICDTAINYPTALAKKLIQELKDKDVLFAEDTVLDISQEIGQPTAKVDDEISSSQPPFEKPILTQRSGFDSSDEYEEFKLCESTVELQTPKIAENRNNTWKFILNDDQEPIQVFRAERCKFRRSKCSEKMNFLPNYEGFCVQRWTLKEMYYIEEDGSSAPDYFKVPTCCSCRLFHKSK